MEKSYLRLKKGNNDFKEIYFIRHGETDYNKQKRSQGQEADIPLNSTGKEQIKKTGLYLKKFRMESGPFEHIYASPMKRAKESAKIIKNIIEFNGNIQYEDCLKERKHGALSGLINTDPLMEKIKKLEEEITPIDPIEKYAFHDKFAKIINKKYDIGEETYEELKERVKPFIEELINSPYKKILVIAHGGSLAALIKQIFNINPMPAGEFHNGSNCWICYLTYNNGFELVSPVNNEHLKLEL